MAIVPILIVGPHIKIGVSVQLGMNPPSDSAHQTKVPRTVVALGVVSLLHDIAGDMVTPLLPAFLATLGSGPEVLGLIEGVADSTASVLKLASGYLADRVGRLKTLTLCGYSVATVLRPLLALTHAWWQVLIVRFGDRVGKGIRASPRDALLAAVTPEGIRGRAYGLHQALEYVGAIAGPGLGYLLLTLGMPLRHVLAWSAVPGILALTLLAVSVSEAPRPKAILKMEFGFPRSSAFRRFLLASVVFTLGNSSDAFLLWHAREVGVPTSLAPVLWILLHVMKSVSSLWGGVLSDRRGRRLAILSGWVFYAAVYVGFGFANRAWARVGAIRCLWDVLRANRRAPEGTCCRSRR